jgi:hypothetical protein
MMNLHTFVEVFFYIVSRWVIIQEHVERLIDNRLPWSSLAKIRSISYGYILGSCRLHFQEYMLILRIKSTKIVIFEFLKKNSWRTQQYIQTLFSEWIAGPPEEMYHNERLVSHFDVSQSTAYATHLILVCIYLI